MVVLSKENAMKLTATTLIMIGLTEAAPPCLAANTNNPYSNANSTNDAGNDTGDSQVEALNQAQIDDGPQPIRPARASPRFAPPAYAYAPPETYAPSNEYYPSRPYEPARTYAPPPSYEPDEAYAAPGYPSYPPRPTYPPAGYAQQSYGPGPYASGYYAPRGYYPPQAYYPQPGYAPPPGY